MSENTLTYIANAGVLLCLGGKKILIDPLTKPGNEIYQDTDNSVRTKLFIQASPYDHVDLVLITHHHRDHFDAPSVLECLKAHSGAVLVSTTEVVSRLEALNVDNQIDPSRLKPVSLELYESVSLEIADIRLLVFRTLHDGTDYADVPNLMFVAESGLTIAHLGDSAPTVLNFQHVHHALSKPLDVLIANFPYVAIPAARKLVQTQLRPAKLVIVHLPDPEKEAASWIPIAKRSYERVKDQFIPVHFMETTGATISL
jgi:L-ascorbate metabolism protein UlaG (beta-lactamase superfamily)